MPNKQTVIIEAKIGTMNESQFHAILAHLITDSVDKVFIAILTEYR